MTSLVDALEPERWERANRELTAKVLTELTFEELLRPEVVTDHGDGRRDLSQSLSDTDVVTWTARLRHLGHWRADPASVRWHRDGVEIDLPDIAELVAIAAPAIGVDPSTTANAIVEMSNTVLSDAAQLADGRPAKDLVDLDPLLVEGELRGHPWIVANKGRIGFDVDDLERFAPEAQQPMHLRWLAVEADRADAGTVSGLTMTDVLVDQLGRDGFDRLRDRAAGAGLDPDTAAYLPVHPWQWTNRIIPLHAGDLARGRIVDLGPAEPRYLPQQSIRTLADADDPTRRYMKLPVSILNTSVHRGLPRARTIAAPALTDWFGDMVAGDAFLAETGLVLLGEVASVSVAHRDFERIDEVPYQHTELLGAIWRESVQTHLEPGERAVSLAALMHRDPWGNSYVAEEIARSDLDVDDWVRRLHEVTLPPLVHVLYRFGATFSPHGQNCLLVTRDHVPVRLVVKDFVDDAMISAEALPELASLPPTVRETLGGGLESLLLVQWIQGGLLVCVHRYVSEILDEDLGYPEAAFWAHAERALRRYQDRFEDELGGRFALFDLEAPAFVKLCLNRVRLLERGYDDDAERPIASASGFIDNPLCPAEPAPGLDARPVGDVP